MNIITWLGILKFNIEYANESILSNYVFYLQMQMLLPVLRIKMRYSLMLARQRRSLRRTIKSCLMR